MAEVVNVILMEQNTRMCSDPTVCGGGGTSHAIEEDLLCARPCAGDLRTRVLAATIRRTWQTSAGTEIWGGVDSGGPPRGDSLR